MKKFTIAFALAATVVATPVMASTVKCPGNIARAGGDVGAYVKIIVSFLGGRIFGEACSPN